MARTDPYPGTQAIRRAVSLLKAFTDKQPEWTLANLSAAVGLNKTTVYRALAALEGEGLVERVPGGEGYRLGPELVALGARALRANDLRTVSRAELEALAREARETATLETPVQGEVMILDEVTGPGFVGMHAEIGTRWPMHATSTGKALLACAEEFHGKDAFAELGLTGHLARFTPHTLTTREELGAELARVRVNGFAVAFEELQPGYAAVGAAVRNHDGRPVAAIAIGGPTGRLTLERIPELGELVRLHAQRISKRLGASMLGALGPAS